MVGGLVLLRRPPAALRDDASDRDTSTTPAQPRLLAESPDYRPGADSRYGFLPAVKRDAVRRIDAEFAQRERELHLVPDGAVDLVNQPHWQELRREHRSRLRAVMNAGELAEYDRRLSPLAERLVYDLTAIDATVDEYRAAFPLFRNFEATWHPGEPVEHPTPEYWRARQEATRKLEADLLARFGDARGRLVIRSRDSDFVLTTAMVRKLGLPAHTATTIADVRDAVARRALALVDSPEAPVEVRQRLQALAATARSELTAALGQPAFDAIGGDALRWLVALEKGVVMTSDPLNQLVTIRHVAQRSPPPEAADPYRVQTVPMGTLHIPGAFGPPEPPLPLEN
jgi:hypothetical protein